MNIQRTPRMMPPVEKRVWLPGPVLPSIYTATCICLDRELIERAKAYARRTGKSVSEMVADFFAQLEAHKAADTAPRSPAVESLAGALAGKKVSEVDYQTYLVEKHR